MPASNTFTRPTIIAAANLLTHFTHSELDNLMIEFGVEAQVTGGNKQDKVNDLCRVALVNEPPLVETVEGTMTLHEAIVRTAVTVPPGAWYGTNWEIFGKGLKRDGFDLVEDEDSGAYRLQRMLPEIADLPAANDDVHRLLETHNFTEPLGHLAQAINAHTRGEWAAANAQLRNCLEGLLNEIAERLVPEKARITQRGHHRRALLASLNPPFLIRALNEWRDNDKADLINGLFKRLHPQGSHPGLSDEEDSTFRLHIVLITARLLLRRFASYQAV